MDTVKSLKSAPQFALLNGDHLVSASQILLLETVAQLRDLRNTHALSMESLTRDRVNTTVLDPVALITEVVLNVMA